MVKLALFCSSRKHLRNVLIEAREIPGKRNIYSRSHAAADKHKGKSALSAACMLGKKDGFMKADRVGFSAENTQLQSHTSLRHFMLSHRTANVKRGKRTNTHTRIQISSQREGRFVQNLKKEGLSWTLCHKQELKPALALILDVQRCTKKMFSNSFSHKTSSFKVNGERNF